MKTVASEDVYDTTWPSPVQAVMARLRILAAAASYQGSLAYSCTLGHNCWDGVGKAFDIVGMVTPPVTVSVMILRTESMVIETVDQVLNGRADCECIEASLEIPVPEAIKPKPKPRVGQTKPLGQNQMAGSLLPAPSISPALAVRWKILRQAVPSAVDGV